MKIKNREYQKYSDEDQGILLGESRLGLDFITGNSYDDYSKHLDIQIGPLKNSSFTEFIHQGNKKKLISNIKKTIKFYNINLIESEQPKIDVTQIGWSSSLVSRFEGKRKLEFDPVNIRQHILSIYLNPLI